MPKWIMKILNDNVLIEDIGEMETEVGGILLPFAVSGLGTDETGAGSRRYDCRIGRVLGVGPKADHLSIGDEVYTAPMKGKRCNFEGKECKIYSIDEIFGIIMK